MSIRMLQRTLPAVGSQPLVLDTERHGIRQAILQGDDGNSAAFFVGDSAMATDGSEGIRVNFSLTVPPFMEIGPFNAGAPINTDEVFLVGTEADIINVFIVTH